VRAIRLTDGDVISEHLSFVGGLDANPGVLTDDGLLVVFGAYPDRHGLFGIQTAFGGLAKSGFPKLHADNQNTMRVRGIDGE
jgi:hypothetical protein